MKSTAFALASLLASVAVAQPHRQHQHQHRAKHAKKDTNSNVVWVTDWVSVTETVGYTTTIWVDEGFVPPTAAGSTPSPSSQAAPVATAAASPAPAQFFEPAKQPSSPSVYVAPTPSSTYVAPAPSVPAVSVAVAQSPTSVYVAPPTTAPAPAPAYTAPAPAPSPAAPASSAAAGTGSGSTTSSCSSGSPCTGDFTYYDAGLGACGITNDGSKDKIVALSVDMMGGSSNSGNGQNANSYCGKSITVSYNGKTTTAKVVDKCMGCSKYSIDLSNAAYADLADESVGRATASWWFN